MRDNTFCQRLVLKSKFWLVEIISLHQVDHILYHPCGDNFLRHFSVDCGLPDDIDRRPDGGAQSCYRQELAPIAL